MPIETSDVTGLDAEQATQDGRITAVESDVTSQDGRITAVESDITTQDGRITAVELNQNDGVERWGTLALLTSNGSDSTTISYKVDSDPTSTNNGFYEYTGAAYVLVAPLLNGDVVEGESEGVTGGKVYESIKDFAPKTVGVNNFTQEGAVENFYVKYGNGVLTANAGYWASAKITLLPNTTYTYSVEQTDNNIEQFAMYDVNDVYIEGYAASGLKTITFTTAANCDNIRFSINKASLDSSYMLETGDVRSQRYQPYNVGIPQSEMELQGVSSEYLADDVFNALGIIKEVITVDINGGKDFTNIRDAVDSITDTTKNYLIKIEEGVYELLDEYSIGEIEDVAFKGQDIPENVWLEGVGNRDDVHLRGYLDSGVYSAAAMIRVSGLNFVGTGGIKNYLCIGVECKIPYP